jgi:hypothetical protein
MQALPIALMAGAQIVQGVAGYEAGKYNRKVGRINARNALLEGNAEASRMRDLARISLGRQLGAQAESGFEIGTGTAIDSLLESATEAELEAMDAVRQAQLRARAFRAQGDMAYAEGYNRGVQGLFGAAAAVAQGKADYAAARNG